jgi:hypothetical protein
LSRNRGRSQAVIVAIIPDFVFKPAKSIAEVNRTTLRWYYNIIFDNGIMYKSEEEVAAVYYCVVIKAKVIFSAGACRLASAPIIIDR